MQLDGGLPSEFVGTDSALLFARLGPRFVVVQRGTDRPVDGDDGRFGTLDGQPNAHLAWIRAVQVSPAVSP